VIETKSRRFGHCKKLSESFKAQNFGDKEDFNCPDINKKGNTGQSRHFLKCARTDETVKSDEIL